VGVIHVDPQAMARVAIEVRGLKQKQKENA